MKELCVSKTSVSKTTFKRSLLRALSSVPLWLMLVSVGVLAASRFFYLQADFPAGLGAQGVLYTDEGWWARNAVVWVRKGSWYIDDGYNPIINLPVVPLIQMLWFKAFGVSLGAARALSAVLSVGVSVLVFLLVRREVSDRLAWLAPVLVLSSFPTFAYSRLALLEMPMLFLILLGLWLIPCCVGISPSVRTGVRLRRQDSGPASILGRPLVRIVLSAIAFGGALLAKTTALFTLPIFLWLLWAQPHAVWKNIRRLLIWLLTLALLYGLYYAVFVVGQPSNSEYFTSYNVTGKLVHENAFTFLRGPFRAMKRSLMLFPLLLPCLLGSLFVLFGQKAYRHSQIFTISTLWSFLALAAFSISNYAPPRYFIVLIVPISMAIPPALQSILPVKDTAFLENSKRTNSIKRLLPFIVTASVVVSVIRTSVYLASPVFTFSEMAQSVASYIEQHPQKSDVVMGHFSDSVALAAPITAVNDKMGFQSLSHRLDTFQPSYYLFAGSIEDTDAIGDFDYRPSHQMKEDYRFELIETFDVYPGRIYQRPVFLYGLSPR